MATTTSEERATTKKSKLSRSFLREQVNGNDVVIDEELLDSNKIGRGTAAFIFALHSYEKRFQEASGDFEKKRVATMVVARLYANDSKFLLFRDAKFQEASSAEAHKFTIEALEKWFASSAEKKNHLLTESAKVHKKMALSVKRDSQKEKSASSKAPKLDVLSSAANGMPNSTPGKSEWDLVLGRGRPKVEHQAGYERYQRIIKAHHKEYLKATAHKTKRIIVANIVHSIKASGGRFLRKENKGQLSMMSDTEAQASVAQGLRSFKHSIKSPGKLNLYSRGMPTYPPPHPDLAQNALPAPSSAVKAEERNDDKNPTTKESWGASLWSNLKTNIKNILGWK